jgi:hypothetical protein
VIVRESPLPRLHRRGFFHALPFFARILLRPVLSAVHRARRTIIVLEVSEIARGRNPRCLGRGDIISPVSSVRNSAEARWSDELGR